MLWLIYLFANQSCGLTVELGVAFELWQISCQIVNEASLCCRQPLLLQAIQPPALLDVSSTKVLYLGQLHLSGQSYRGRQLWILTNRLTFLTVYPWSLVPLRLLIPPNRPQNLNYWGTKGNQH